MERILKVSIDLIERKEIQEKRVLVDTTVQEKNITYPTDTKLQKKIIEKYRGVAKEEGIQLRQSYKRTLKQLMIDQRFREHPRRKKTIAAARKIKTIAGRIVRDVERKLSTESLGRYEQDLLLFHRAKKYEFGNKASFVKTMKSGIIVGALSFNDKFG